MNIYLIGFRCTGKTSVGRLLAEKLNRRFMDADVVLAENEGRIIADIVAEHGWPCFREKEKQTIRELSRLNGLVVATGGGAVLDPENVARMEESGRIIWLRAESETIKQRIRLDEASDPQRPALTAKGFVDEVDEVLAGRRPLYEAAAGMALDTDNMSIAELVEMIAQKMTESEG